MVMPDFVTFGDVVTKRVLPTFDTFGTEAVEHGEEWFRERAEGLNPMVDEDFNAGSYFADKAMDETLAFADRLISMYFASLGLYSLGLFHLFEQHAADLALRLIDNRTYPHEVKLKEVTNWLKSDVKIEVESFQAWPIVSELRLVSNTIKHAEGGSASALRQLRPELFVHPAHREDPAEHAWARGSRIRKPLFGEDVWVSPADFDRYVKGIDSFWVELATQMEQLP